MTLRTCAPLVNGATLSRGQISRELTPCPASWSVSSTQGTRRGMNTFEQRGPFIVGLTATGRTTAEVLMMNEVRRVQLRAELIARGEL